MSLLTLYAKKEPTRDPIDIKLGFAKRHDTVLYRDPACTTLAARWPWHMSNCPRRSSKIVMLNCWRWKLSWVN